MRRLMPGLALAAICAALLAVAARAGSFVAGGSDSYCYVHQAERWASGRLLVPEPLALAAPWPDAPLTFAPAGHRPSPTVPGAIVPICPPGLSLLMAPFLIAGGPRGDVPGDPAVRRRPGGGHLPAGQPRRAAAWASRRQP